MNACTSLLATAVRLFPLNCVWSAGSADAPGKLALRFTKYPFFLSFHYMCVSKPRYRSLLIVSRSVFTCQISLWQTQLSAWNHIPSLENSVLFAYCREITLLLFSGSNLDNWLWVSRQIAFQSNHAEGGIELVLVVTTVNFSLFFFFFFGQQAPPHVYWLLHLSGNYMVIYLKYTDLTHWLRSHWFTFNPSP